MDEIQIGNKKVGDEYPTFIVAELSANHNQDYDVAVKTIKAMAEAGADAVKLQTYTADTITIDCDNEYFQIKQGTIWDGTTLHKLYQTAYTPWDWQPKLKKIAEELGLILFSSPFDKTAVDFLEKMNVPAYKIASPEINDLPLIKYIAKKNKPIIISTGVANLKNIEEAISTCKETGNNQIILLKCTTEYPAQLDEANLKTIPNMRDTFGVISGLSDHTLGISAPIAAVALGAKVIEKHFILDRKMGGPDATFSLEPQEFKEMVKNIREVEKALGTVKYDPPKKLNVNFSCRSLFVVADINAREELTDENIKSIRPGFGLEPKYLEVILGKKAKKDLKKGTPLSWDLIE